MDEDKEITVPISEHCVSRDGRLIPVSGKSYAWTEEDTPDKFRQQGEVCIDDLERIDKRIVEMQKSEYCYVNVGVIRKMIDDLATEIEDMLYSVR